VPTHVKTVSTHDAFLQRFVGSFVKY